MKRLYAKTILIFLGMLLAAGGPGLAAEKAAMAPTYIHAQTLSPMTTMAAPTARGVLAVGPVSGAIEVAVNDTGSDETGRFTIGEPNSGPILLYGHPSPWSSYTTVRIDGGNYVPLAADLQAGDPLLVGGQSVTRWHHPSGVSLTQTLSLISATPGGEPNTVEIRYAVRNNDSSAHDIGLRIMLDTMLGNNDGAPFRVPNIGDITTETEFLSADIPQYFDVFDDLANPTVQAKGSIVGSSATPPDRLVMAHWGKIYDSPWDYVIDNTSVFSDTALAYFWNPVSVGAGEERVFVTYYGLGQMSVVTSGDFTLALSSYSALARRSDNSLDPNPFLVTAYIQNSGNADIYGASAEISLPQGLSLAAGDAAVKNVGDLSPAQQKQIAWQVAADVGAQGDLSYTVTLSDNTGNLTVQASKTVTIPGANTIAAVEYYIDTDPGVGHGTSLAADDGAFDETVETVSVTGAPLPGLSEGLHALHIRYRDALGNWSQSSSQTFIYTCTKTISAVEVFIDNDPGEGNGIALTAADGAFDESSESIDPVQLPIAGLSNGLHVLFFRYRDQDGNWSAPFAHPFVYSCSGGIVTGSVQTLAPGYPVGVLGATITFAGAGYQTATIDPSGHFQLSDVPPGVYDVIISAPHHESVTLSGISVIAGDTTDIGGQLLSVSGNCLPGDANQSATQDLGDAIFILQVLSGSRQP